jgi:DNA-binding NarL/FixJ family response regulator
VPKGYDLRMKEPRGERRGVVLGTFEDLFARGLTGVIEDEGSLVLLARDVPPGRLAGEAARLRPAAIILDVASLTAPHAVRDLAHRVAPTRLVLVADGRSAPECAQLLSFGAAACITRATQRRDVLTAIHLAARGIKLAPLQGDGRPGGPTATLTARETEVLAELQRGRANAQIASDLHVSVETVRTHVRSVYRKLGVRSRRELRLADDPLGGLRRVSPSS